MSLVCSSVTLRISANVENEAPIEIAAKAQSNGFLENVFIADPVKSNECWVSRNGATLKKQTFSSLELDHINLLSL
ncbi:hypothetical protein THF1C08_20139 [Vibrio jasicida]|uniref:Uncharacterized protein n=1 Tax=Vibrio jasicida TaxID=766224 RepID=A0AAU9QJQ7_9VIBR|nr:hypothetical protein THF1C08_20139 [Vibrio jasicida]CAH1585035.1 hypothetical protein THF1A12_20140 [Vibrio jasicida]